MTNRLIKLFNITGLTWFVPVVKICAGENPVIQIRQLWLTMGVPVLAFIAFLGLWSVSAAQIQTSLGAIPGPTAVWQEVIGLIDDHYAERGKEAAFYERQRIRNEKKLAADPEAEVKIRPYTGKPTYLLCNADEGEPGTFKDRVLLNSYADQVIEGMTLCAAIVGAKQGFIYLRGEYLHLFEKLQNILQQRRQQGLLGRAILQQNFDFDIEIRLGAGAYICGEESALIESLEGKPGIPRNRPPYPVSEGYLGKPTVVNNVETFAAAAKIAVAGGDWFAACGTQQSKGSKILSISGDCAKPGIYEYAFGTEIRTVLQDCGAADVLGVQIGGPSGSFIAPPEFGRKLGFEDLATGGSFIIFNNSRSIVEIVRNFTHFFADESCGFCTPCRVGTALLKQQLDKLYNGHSSAGDLVELEKLSRLVKATSHCGLGQTAANPVLTTLQRFPEYYQSLLQEISFEPGFDLDAALGAARELTRRDDKGAHLTQTGE